MKPRAYLVVTIAASREAQDILVALVDDIGFIGCEQGERSMAASILAAEWSDAKESLLRSRR